MSGPSAKFELIPILTFRLRGLCGARVGYRGLTGQGRARQRGHKGVRRGRLPVARYGALVPRRDVGVLRVGALRNGAAHGVRGVWNCHARGVAVRVVCAPVRVRMPPTLNSD